MPERGTARPEPLDKVAEAIRGEIQGLGNDVLGKIGDGVPAALNAVAKFAERQAVEPFQSLSANLRRIREGKVLDAWWHLTTDHLSATEDNAGEAVTESELLRMALQYAASYYGGPWGAAAFAAWATYKETGSVEAAIRAGVVEGMKTYVLAGVDRAFQEKPDELALKAIISGAVGGAAVAASGGSMEDVGRKFLAAGAKVLVFDGYRSEVGAEFMGHKISFPLPFETGSFVMTGVDVALAPRHEIQPQPSAEITFAKAFEVDTAPAGIVLTSTNWCVNWDNQYLNGGELPGVALVYTGTGSLFRREERDIRLRN